MRSLPNPKSPDAMSRLHAVLGAVLLVATALFSSAPRAQDAAQGEVRIALVIGNSAYRSGALRNPHNDADAVATSLKQLGFRVVLRKNTTRRELNDALREFSQSATRSDVRLFFYAGHGVQSKGHNYLVPVDAEVLSEDDLPRQATDISEFLDRLGTVKSGLNLVILDACRNNPFTSMTAQLADARIRTRGLMQPRAVSGLAPVDAPRGTLVAFSTAPGSVARDSSNQENSVYTKHLLQWLNTPGMPVERLFKQVRIGVAQETQSQQVPWETSSLMGDFCFKNEGKKACGG